MLTKIQFINAVAERAEVDKYQVQSVLTAILDICREQLVEGGPGEVSIPNLIRLWVYPGRPARPPGTYPHPFTGVPTYFPKEGKALPAKIKVTPSKVVADWLKKK